SPRPRPRLRWRAALSTWWYSSKIAFNPDSGMPIPVSQISMRKLPCRQRHPTSTLALWVYFSAFRNQVADHLLEETTIASNGQCAGNYTQREAGRLRVVCQLVAQAVE